LLKLSEAEKQHLGKAKVFSQNRHLDSSNTGVRQPVTDAVNSKGEGRGAEGLFDYLQLHKPHYLELVHGHVREVQEREKRWQNWTTDDQVRVIGKWR
jgi:hypothetical protein